VRAAINIKVLQPALLAAIQIHMRISIAQISVKHTIVPIRCVSHVTKTLLQIKTTSALLVSRMLKLWMVQWDFVLAK
jgi:hypothetical protein